jgi:hypothetical protein
VELLKAVSMPNKTARMPREGSLRALIGLDRRRKRHHDPQDVQTAKISIFFAGGPPQA